MRVSELVLSVLFPLLAVCAALGQDPTISDPQYAAPVAWTEYQIRSQHLTITLPKLPVVREMSDPCSESKGAVYDAYAGGVVYEFEWHAKSREPIPSWCQE